MENISKEQVLHVAHLARLEIADEAAEKLAIELRSIINYAEQLNEVDTTDVEPMTHVLNLVNVMRKDEPKEWTTQEDALKNAPDHENGHFRVPSILSE